MIGKALRAFCLLVISLAPFIARADETSNQKPSAPRDLTTLTAEFPQLDAAREAAKPATKERAAVATQAAQTASDIGWLLFEQGESTQAANWFARRAALKKDSYENARAYWENNLATEVGEIEKKMAAQIQSREAELKSATDETRRKELALNIWALTRNRLMMRYNTITMLEQLAREHDDSTRLLQYSLQELAVRREELADLQKLTVSANEIAIKNSQLAKALERVADAQGNLAMFVEAEKNLRDAEKIRRALPADLPERELHQTLSSFAHMYLHRVGDFARAREYYAQALKEFGAEAPVREQTIQAEKTTEAKDFARVNATMAGFLIVVNLAGVTQEQGEYGAAETGYQSALQISQSLPPGGVYGIFELYKVVMRARTLSDLADLHASVGDYQKATAELDESIQLYRAIGRDESTAGALQQAARLAYSRGDNAKAKTYLEQARLIFQQSQKLQSIVTTTSFLATLAREDGNVEEAAKLAEEALPPARQSGNIGVAAGALRTLASVRLSQKRLVEATTLLDEAARFDARAGSTLDQISTLGWQGQVLEAQGANELALEKYKNAVTLLESIRKSGGGENFGENKSTAKSYERLVLLLIKMNKGEEAFDYLGRARSKQLQESLRLTSLKTGDKNVQSLLARVSTLETQLQATRGQLQEEQAKPAVEQNPKKIENLKVLIASTQGEYRRVVEKIKTEHESYEKLLGINPMELREAQGAIPDDAALIAYAPLGTQFFIFVVTNEDLKIFAPPVAVDELWKRVRATRTQITRPTQNPVSTRGASLAPLQNGDTNTLTENLVALHEMLIAPIESAVADKNTLAFIPTQLLHYLPMAALAKYEKNGDKNSKLRFLIEDKQIVTLSAADVMRVVKAKRAGKMTTGLIAFGDPTGANLPSAREEVLSIAKIFPGTEAFTDAQVTKAAVTDSAALQKRIVHFATHGILKPGATTSSYILLAKSATAADEQLTVGEVWDLPLKKVDLVTLSACETALAEGTPSGGEITTLAEAFSSAGAQSIVATLWSVADDSIKTWMVEFYTGLAAGKPKAEAFRAAQLKLLQSKEYSHPYYWAPFVLMGDWR